MKIQKIIVGIVAVAGVLSLSVVSQSAHADLLINPVGGTIAGPVAGVYTYSYDVNLATPEILDTGSYFTIYDFNGYVASSVVTPANWSVSEQALGETPSSQNINDSSLFPNFTFTYTGSTVNPPSDIGTFVLQSTIAPASGMTGRYSGSLTNGLDTFQHPLTEPTAAPEPSSVAAFAFTGMGIMGLMLFARKRRSSMTA